MNYEKDNIETGEFILKGTKYYKNQLEEAGLKLKFFNDVITEKRPPQEESGYHLVQADVHLPDGSVVDVYHTDVDDSTHFARVFLHIKKL